MLARRAAPSAGRVDQVGLNVEDELVARQDVCGGCRLQRALPGQTEETASIADCREGVFQGQQRSGSTAERLQKGPASKPNALRVLADPQFGFAVGARYMPRQWHRTKLAVGRRIDLDRKRPSQLVHHDFYLSAGELLLDKFSASCGHGKGR